MMTQFSRSNHDQYGDRGTSRDFVTAYGFIVP
jgi:hypothetical protein